jgi:TRAP-type C4-dicarboxylate transport system permease small subunit
MTDRDPQSTSPHPPVSDTDMDQVVPETARSSSRLRSIAFGTGSAALLLAMATDALAVAGRHAGVTVLGAIEVVQACEVVVATSAIVIATIDGAHARVRILLEQVGAATATMLDRAANIVSALVLLGVVAGSFWLASDLWNGQEITEVLGLPLRWLRLFWIAGAFVTAGLFAVFAARRRP